MVAAVFLTVSAQAASQATQGAERSEQARVAVFSGFSQKTVGTVFAALRNHKVFKTAPVFLGDYGIDPELAATIHQERAHWYYAPMFTAVNRKAPDRPERTLSADELSKLPESAAEYAGALPHDFSYSKDPVAQIRHAMARLPEDTQLHWGLEIGRRLRDIIRAKERQGIVVDSWQFDEVISEAYDPSSNGDIWRRFMAGELHGLTFGRPELGDKPLRGLICLAHPERFAQIRGETANRLLEEVNRSGRFILGEEYPAFEGDAVAAAKSAYQQTNATLKRRGGVAARIAERYVPLLTPGYDVLNDKKQPTGYNGNVLGWSDAKVNVWRARYVRERARQGVAGLGEYNFVAKDARPAVVNATVAAIAAGLDPRP